MRPLEKYKNIKEPIKEWFFSWKMKEDCYRERKKNQDKDFSFRRGSGYRDIKVYRKSKKTNYLK